MPWWAWILATIGSVSIFAAAVVMDRRMIRRRIMAAGGTELKIVGPFPAWGFQGRMGLRRYGVMYTDSEGRAREIDVFVSMGHFEAKDGRSL